MTLRTSQIHHLDGDDRKSYPGLPQNHVPVIASTFDSALLSATGPATIPASDAPIDSTYNHSTHRSLLLVNRQINEELTSHFKFPKNRQTSVFASYPYGLHILKTTASQLLEQAQSVHIAGLYVSTSFSPSRAAYCASLGPPITPRQKHNGDTTPNSTAQLGQLVASSFGPDPIYHIRKLEMRIYYPGVDSYSTVWGDDDSPTVVALRSISNAEVGIEVWRGAKGTGIYLAAKPASERKRVVSTVWRKLEEGRGDDPKVESWWVLAGSLCFSYPDVWQGCRSQVASLGRRVRYERRTARQCFHVCAG